MSKKRGRSEKAMREKARAYYECQIASMDEAAEAISRFYRRETSVHLIVLMACALVQAQERDAREAMEKGDIPQEGGSAVFSYNVEKELDAYLDKNWELSRYADCLSYLIRERPAWVADRAVIEEGGAE